MGVKIRVSVSVPKKLFQDIEFVEEVKDIMERKTTADLMEEFFEVSEDWDNSLGSGDVRDTVKQTTRSISASVEIYGNSKAARVFRMLTLGSPPHAIYPRRKPFLVYQPGYIAATRPGSLSSGRKSRFGNPIASLGVPNHPGFDPRKFDELIAKKYEPTFRKDMQEAIDKAVERFNGGV